MQKTRNGVRNVVRTTIATIVVAASLVAGGSAANANANGSVSLGAITIGVKGQSVSIPTAVLNYSIQGTGRRADVEHSKIGQVLNCYPRIDFTERGSGDALITRSKGSVSAGCVKVTTQRTRTNIVYTNSTTKACASAYSNDIYRNAACHWIS